MAIIVLLLCPWESSIDFCTPLLEHPVAESLMFGVINAKCLPSKRACIDHYYAGFALSVSNHLCVCVGGDSLVRFVGTQP